MRIKNILMSFLALVVLSSAAFGYIPNLNSTYDYNTDGSTATADIAASTGRSIVIDNIQVMSDLSTSLLKIYIGAAAGTTDNYTQVLEFDIGDTTTSFPANANAGSPFLKLDLGYQARFTVDATTKNSLIVNWHME